jgi:heat shock protein HslJ
MLRCDKNRDVATAKSFTYTAACPAQTGAAKADAQVAQLVEQRTENPRVAGSIPALGTILRSFLGDVRRRHFVRKAGGILLLRDNHLTTSIARLAMMRFLKCAAIALALLGPGVALAHEEMLEGSEWGVVGDAEPKARFISFAGQGRVFGYSGCNRFSGTYEQHDEHLTISPLATTRMACVGDGQTRETEFLEMLGRVRGAKVDHTLLLFLDEKGGDLKALIRRSAPPPADQE